MILLLGNVNLVGWKVRCLRSTGRTKQFPKIKIRKSDQNQMECGRLILPLGGYVHTGRDDSATPMD
jgi:hypothetical protein